MDSGRSMSEADELATFSPGGTASAATVVAGSGGSGTGSAPNGSTYINYQDDDECIDEAFEAKVAGQVSDSTGYMPSSNINATSSAAHCVALYSFQVCHLHRHGVDITLTYSLHAIGRILVNELSYHGRVCYKVGSEFGWLILFCICRRFDVSSIGHFPQHPRSIF